MLTVIEDREEGLVMVNGREIDGYIDGDNCPECFERRIYFDYYDAYFCAKCNKWLESGCSDATCERCKNRPDKPV